MNHLCPNCNKKFEGRLNKKYCSNKCRERQRFLRRKDEPNFKNTQNARWMKYYYNGGKDKKIDRQRGKKFRDYQNEWRRKNKYHIKTYENNPESNREKSKRHRKTDKGKLNILKSNEQRRKKNILLTGTPKDFLSIKELKIIDERDIVCVYCQNEFNVNDNKKKPTYDHLDFNKRLSLTNAVKCCWSCNSSKRNVPIEKILEWVRRKRFSPSPIVMELLKKNYINFPLSQSAMPEGLRASTPVP